QSLKGGVVVQQRTEKRVLGVNVGWGGAAVVRWPKIERWDQVHARPLGKNEAGTQDLQNQEAPSPNTARPAQ
ncbi:MAG: hypothetical protein JWQ97_955, partial [Phenylobacterium sp.]|nr:hypothetical protein [Phenylobacterium sp.]